MLKKLQWQAFTNEDRNSTIEKVKEVISGSDGYITNFHMFSDLALSLSIEITENSIHELHKALGNVLTVSEFNPEDIRPTSKKEWLLFVNISFGRGTGELKKEVPAVPG